ncbi:hypothetical protein FQP90_18375 [Paenarthrobacter nitroguajacolicus]|uniref:Uncharacterized protein n=1 Tax=Paenarthrobacter nitroguajacolicus TaxID=211146 RepID=A0A558GS13_PAENT|nr:hypothetical protein [Paenarthrobacter nitroguajacolicus]TVU59671.1 hypothetical protein FQP90_18375 [Paenarthrobacter nitroguajacolicus]
MNLPLFHDPLQGAVTVDAPSRDPQLRRPAHTTRRQAHPATRSAKPSSNPTHSARQREVAKVAEDLQALMARTAHQQ